MSTAYVYTDVSERYGVRAFACVVLFENNHHWEVGECPASDLSCSYAEVSSLHRGIVRAMQLAPEATLTAYTDIDCVPELLTRRRYRGQMKPLLENLQVLLDARPGRVRVVSVPRKHEMYQECHRRARAAAKRLLRSPAKSSPVPMRKLPNLCSYRPPQPFDLLQTVFDLGAASVVGTESQRAEAAALLDQFKLKYPQLVGIKPRS